MSDCATRTGLLDLVKLKIIFNVISTQLNDQIYATPCSILQRSKWGSIHHYGRLLLYVTLVLFLFTYLDLTLPVPIICCSPCSLFLIIYSTTLDFCNATIHDTSLHHQITSAINHKHQKKVMMQAITIT